MKVDNERITAENLNLHSKIREQEDNEEVLKNQVKNLLMFIEELENKNSNILVLVLYKKGKKIKEKT